MLLALDSKSTASALCQQPVITSQEVLELLLCGHTWPEFVRYKTAGR